MINMLYSEKVKRIKGLVKELNTYRNAYYNDKVSLVEDKKYDDLFEELKNLEDDTGLYLSNSPTQSVGYEVQSKLNKVNHDHPMLSLDKTKDFKDIIKFADDKDIICMLKMDGLTVTLHYNENGELDKAETRGNGLVGEDVLKNVKVMSNIPLKIDNAGVPYIIDGEAIIDKDTFNEINSKLSEDEQYSHPRNLASGTIRQLDTKITADRNMQFIAWRVIDGDYSNLMSERLDHARDLGFDVVPYTCITGKNLQEWVLKENSDYMKKWSEKKNYPIDGLVYTYQDISYGLSLGSTGHHPKHSFAFKFEDDTYETVLRDIEWSTSRSGMVNPVAVFDSVDIEGTKVSRATLHNVSIMKNLELGIGDTITIYRANQVIPKVADNLTRSNTYVYPTVCPCCGEPLELKNDGIAEVLYCYNEECPAKVLSKFTHFVSKQGMDIDGLSESTLEKLIDRGFIKKYADIYNLDKYAKQIQSMDGFGKKSYDKLIASIEKSRNVKLENFLVALGIPLIGKSASKAISNAFNGDYESLIEYGPDFDFTQLEDFGDSMNVSMHKWLTSCPDIEVSIQNELKFIKEEKKEVIENDFIMNKVFCVTGAFKTMKRSEIEKIITDRGGKLSGSVSKKTDYLLTNEADSGSSKAKKAQELGTPIMSEEEFLSKIGE